MAVLAERCELMMRPGFEDYAALEEGSAREYMDSSLLAQHNGLQLCRLMRVEKWVFVLEDEDGQHLLTAKKHGQEYRISAYHQCSAVVRCGNSYKLHLCVGSHVLDDHLVEIWPRSTNFNGQFLRRLTINLPPPTQERRHHYVHDYRKLTENEIPRDHNNRKKVDPNRLRLSNKLPVLKSDGTYSLKFARGRARVSSSKNFLVFLDDDLKQHPDTHPDLAVFQLGKLGAKSFALDFRFPMSPLQAFAIALAAFDSKVPHRP